jgi:transposase-like protein
VVLMAVRWYLRHPLSGSSVMELLAERGVDVSKRTVLRWVQTFGPLLAAEARTHRRRPGGKWYVDEVSFVRRSEKRYLYRPLTSMVRCSTSSSAIIVTVSRLRRSSNGRWTLLASSLTR